MNSLVNPYTGDLGSDDATCKSVAAGQRQKNPRKAEACGEILPKEGGGDIGQTTHAARRSAAVRKTAWHGPRSRETETGLHIAEANCGRSVFLRLACPTEAAECAVNQRVSLISTLHRRAVG
jgi:hypothetical protein